MKCPCRKCNNVNYKVRSEIFSDLILHGMMRNYTTWFHHGESLSSTVSSSIAPQDTCFEVRNNNDERPGDDLFGMLRAVCGIPMRDDEGMDDRGDGEGTDDMDDDEYMDSGDGGVSGLPSNCTASRFYKFLEESKIPLYPGCEKMSVMSFLVRFWNYKCVGGMSEKSAKDMLQLMRDSFPDNCNLPENFTQCKKILSELGLTYNKINACPNDCILYYKEYADRETCHVCKASRYKDGTKTPSKILLHFPLRPRLQRLYMESKTAGYMRWHAEGRPRDGKMRHPADSEAWKHFDEMNPTFAAEPRNIRLGLATDGNDIDVYLRPLIDELKELWEEGANTYDSSRNEMFNMRVGLLWTISDYPGLAMLSGWSTKGKLACPTCQEDTRHQRLKHGRKTCYMGHRRFLPIGHRFRSLTKEFNGNVEYGSPPNPLLGPDILQKLKHIPHVLGKQFEDSLMGDRPRKRKERASNTATSNMPGNWKKLSIFYELPYWADNVLKHNLDVMHTEKNVCDSVIGTLLDMDKKAKDGLKVRLDLQLLNLRPELHPIMTANGKKFFYQMHVTLWIMLKSRCSLVS
ncbi:uncharacterized protein LOC113311199 [Papaver somniferum]|uniref:uncharacterized protein LOC113311199 n=1 Tax=Papaver somniferum TaxID=3469 RepID=UPI000E701C90|nr:uncharacterized protein LOC113311199 [Papaver somniferum]